MARVWYHQSTVREKSKPRNSNVLKNLFSLIMVLFTINRKNPIYLFFAFVLRKIIPSIHIKTPENRKYEQGWRGEEEVQKYLNYLNYDQYLVHHSYPRKDADIDHVIIGPNGIFVVQTKNLNGDIKVNDGEFYFKYKNGKNFKIYQENPAEQVKGEKTLLLELLENEMEKQHQRVDLPEIYCILVFGSDTKILENDGSVSVPILKPKDVCSYIENFDGEKISKTRQKKIENLFSISGADFYPIKSQGCH